MNSKFEMLADLIKRNGEFASSFDGCDLENAPMIAVLDETRQKMISFMEQSGYKMNEIGDWVTRPNVAQAPNV